MDHNPDHCVWWRSYVWILVYASSDPVSISAAVEATIVVGN